MLGSVWTMTHMTTTACEECGAAFEYVRRRRPRRFCSAQCRWKKINAGRRQYKQDWWAAHRNEMAEKRAVWLSQNRDKRAASQRRYYEKNREKVIARSAEIAAANPDRVRANKARYAATPHGRDKALEGVHRRRARIVGARGSHTRAQFRKLVAFYENRCLCCRETFDAHALEADHVTPIALGGDNTIFNLQPLCQPCNRRKSDKVVDYRPTWENYL